ncbi:hypothetical protein [Catalinimonas alkaloidigena]|uniref:hypothetical protein n=1 Tax=Catalinimonas alkaloidigena TaxID=1075417 RepID=UPI00115FC5DE|nr:hypothetical protein [Catalinimonas alkaloidigena]
MDTAEKLLRKQGEFYPIGFTVEPNGEIGSISYYEGDDFPKSETLLRHLREITEAKCQQGKSRAYALAYDVLVRREAATEKIDAIAIECRSKERRITYYYPYRIAADSLEFQEPWGIEEE